VGNCADIIALRSKNAGDALLASEYSSVPIINAGDGPGEHPTQSLLDLFTIQKQFKLGEEPIRIAFVGDLKYGRTVHSLSTMIRNFENIDITFIAPEEVQIPDKYFGKNDQKKMELDDDILRHADVIYVTRVQRERFERVSDYEKVQDAFQLTPENVSKMKKGALLLHPLPRVNEIALEVDALPQAQYFAQARNGIPVRMALIARLLKLA